MTNTASPFGRELDSLADVVAFGVAPAVLAYVWGVRAVVEPSGTPQVTQIIHATPWILTFLYVICGAAGLARFNIDTVKPVGSSLLCRNAHSRRGRIRRCCGPLPQVAVNGVAVFAGLADRGGNSGLPDDQPHALLQL